jgi:hypothetical protein
MLKLKDIRTDLKFIKNHGLSIFCIRDLIDKNERYNLDFDVYLKSKGKNLQRPFCWTLLQKQELIMSILKGIRIPVLAIIQHTDDYKKREEKVYHIIDGKQRLSTIISFAKGEFPIVFNEQEYFISDLDEWAAREILNYWVTADVAYSYPDVPITDDQKIAWFEMINFAGTPQDIEHLNNLKA